jgi:hypothetical protein
MRHLSLSSALVLPCILSLTFYISGRSLSVAGVDTITSVLGVMASPRVTIEYHCTPTRRSIADGLGHIAETFVLFILFFLIGVQL